MKSFLRLIQSYSRLTGSLPTETTPLQRDSHVSKKHRGASLAKSVNDGKSERMLNVHRVITDQLKGTLSSIYGHFPAAAVVVRSLIRESRRSGEMSIELLSVLYDLAAINSFLHSIPFEPEVREPARNVFEFIYAEQWEQILKYDYDSLGFDNLTLLNKTDRVWLKEAWGDTYEHTTLRALHEDKWREAVRRLQKRRWQEFIALPPDLAPGEFELHYAKSNMPTFEEYLDMKHKSWEIFDKEQMRI